MGTKRQLIYNPQILGDVGLEAAFRPELTSEIVLGQDALSTDRVLELGASIKALCRQNESLDEREGSVLPKEATIPYAPAEPPAASLIQEIPFFYLRQQG